MEVAKDTALSWSWRPPPLVLVTTTPVARAHQQRCFWDNCQIPHHHHSRHLFPGRYTSTYAMRDIFATRSCHLPNVVPGRKAHRTPPPFLVPESSDRTNKENTVKKLRVDGFVPAVPTDRSVCANGIHLDLWVLHYVTFAWTRATDLYMPGVGIVPSPDPGHGGE